MRSEAGRHWLLVPPVEPAANLAAHVLEKNRLTVPVPIEELTSTVAHIEECDWPYQCDAMVVGLLSAHKPTIFLKYSIPGRRRRFTLAHELGHIEMAWHIGEVICHPTASESFNIDPPSAAPDESDIFAQHRLREQEAEATRFAAYLLMPERHMREVVEAGNMDDILSQVVVLDVSVQAFLLRLRSMLQPGFIFAYSDQGSWQFYHSSGTSTPSEARRPDGSMDIGILRKSAIASGAVSISGRIIYWFRLARYESFRPSGETRSSTEIVKSIIARYVDESDYDKVFWSLNGIAGGSMSTERSVSPEQTLGILRHKFSSSVHKEIVADAEFDIYLHRKTEEWLQKRERPAKRSESK